MTKNEMSVGSTGDKIRVTRSLTDDSVVMSVMGIPLSILLTPNEADQLIKMLAEATREAKNAWIKS